MLPPHPALIIVSPIASLCKCFLISHGQRGETRTHDKPVPKTGGIAAIRHAEETLYLVVKQQAHIKDVNGGAGRNRTYCAIRQLFYRQRSTHCSSTPWTDKS